MAKIDPAFAYDVFRFIIKPHRDADTNGVLERYMGSFQEAFEDDQASILDIKTLFDLDNIEDRFLNYLLWIVG